MANVKPKPATYADIEALPPHVTGEIIFGSLVTQPRPARRHSRAATRMGMVLGKPFDMGDDGPGGWVFIDEAELHLGPHVLVPDIAAWRIERFTETEEGPWYEVPPDWVCEILSPSTSKRDRTDKMRIYATCQVQHLWLLDPADRLLEVYERQGSSWLRTQIFQDREDVKAPPFDAITFSLGQFWPFDPPSTEV